MNCSHSDTVKVYLWSQKSEQIVILLLRLSAQYDANSGSLNSSIMKQKQNNELINFHCPIGSNTGIKQYPLERASFCHALQHVRMLKPNVYSA